MSPSYTGATTVTQALNPHSRLEAGLGVWVCNRCLQLVGSLREALTRSLTACVPFLSSLFFLPPCLWSVCVLSSLGFSPAQLGSGVSSLFHLPSGSDCPNHFCPSWPSVFSRKPVSGTSVSTWLLWNLKCHYTPRCPFTLLHLGLISAPVWFLPGYILPSSSSTTCLFLSLLFYS